MAESGACTAAHKHTVCRCTLQLAAPQIDDGGRAGEDAAARHGANSTASQHKLATAHADRVRGGHSLRSPIDIARGRRNHRR